MNNKIVIPCLIFACGVLATGQRLAAQSGNSNVGNMSGLMAAYLAGTLSATTSTGQDVSSSLTVVVGQPIPTVTFGLVGSGITSPGSWEIFENGDSVAPGTDDGGAAPGSGASSVYFTVGPNTQLVGTPTQTGLFDFSLRAGSLGAVAATQTNGAFSSTFNYFVNVVAAPATTFTTQPSSQSVAVGQSVTFTAAASGSPTYQWSGPNGVISGATSASLTLTNVQPAAAGAYTVTATVTGGSVTSSSATLTVIPLAMPAITLNPVGVTVASGHSAVFNVTASGELPPTYQWSLNSVPISGATDPVLEIPGATSANAGSYTCTASNSSGSATSTAATLTVATASNPGHLINLSARAAVGTGNNILLGGFGVTGTGTKQLLVRGVGPALSAFFSTELVTPELVMLDNVGAVVATNLGWGGAPVAGASTASESPVDATTNLMNTLGAYTINPGSADTAMVLTMPAGNNTAQISGVGGTSGIALCEIYDADTGTPTARLINISARADVLTGNSILIGGFTIGGATAETVLIRAVGPGLNDELPGLFPLSAVLNQPVLSILDHTGAVIYSNTVWGGDATIAATFGATGAFSLNPAHADSVVLATLPPGNYTAQVSGVNSGTGIALCEIYEVP